MVTFSLPGDHDVASGANGTPKPRAPLPFAKRAYAASSPFGGGAAKRFGTPQSASARKVLNTRDEVPTSSLSNSTIASARNIFRASNISDSPPHTIFSPNLPQSTIKKVFAPGATPEPSRVFRETTAQAAPRGMAAKSTSKELFPMRISSPPPELTGEVLTQKVPKEWSSKGSIYADQFLAHLCPPDLDDEQRRQFFCILDLRRLKYAANEIFSRKDWKLNVVNFAKEFEKSRSIILLRYGLYEFQNVKPSKEVLKRWRREHGLPEPEEDETEPTPTKAVSTKKRKASDDLPKDESATSSRNNDGKRRAMESKPDETSVAAPPPPSAKKKRKASVDDEPPAKQSKSTPSSAKSLFEKIANKSVTKSLEDGIGPKPSAAPSLKSYATNSLARSVFSGAKSSTSQTGSGGNNIFGYLSDASSAKNSGVEADAESSTDSDQDDSQDAGQSDEPSLAASGTGDALSHSGANPFGQKPAPISGLNASDAPESDTGTRESTPGRSLFERVTKNSSGEPVRAADVSGVVAKSSPIDQTWNPSTTPIKFAPSGGSSQAGSLFGASSTAPAGSIFAPKSTSSNIFGAPQQGQTSQPESSAESSKAADKDGGESDKENDGKTSKSAFETKTSTPSAQLNFGSSLQPKPPTVSTEPDKENEITKPTTSLFGASTKPDEKTSASNLFGSINKSTESTASPAVLQSSTLFGAKPSSESKEPTPAAEPPKTSLFGGSQAAPTKVSESGGATSLFGAKPSTTASSLFGSGASTPSSQPLFGGANSNNGSTAPKTDTAPVASQGSAAPMFSFGASTTKPTEAASKPLFAPKSPPTGTASNALFGSPMKQDDPSPAKKLFTGSNAQGATAAPSAFSFGNSQTTTPATSNIFGAVSNPSANGNNAAPSFGGGGTSTSASSGGFGFNFSAGGDTSGTTFNNPFASGGGASNTNGPVAASTGNMFSFGGATPGGNTGGSTFQFGGASGNSTNASGAGIFGGNQATQNTAPAFGGSSAAPGGAPAFNFSAASSQIPQGGAPAFGSNQAAPAFGVNLQPPAGGSSTTGTNSPFNLGGGSSLATTPAAGTPEPSATQANATAGGDEDDGEKHEQIDLTGGSEPDEDVLHEVRAKALKFVPPNDKSDSDEKPKSKSPWTAQGVGPLRLLKHKETSAVRLLLRAEPRGHVALNRTVLPNISYKADEKYVKMTTSNDKGDGLETWMIQVKTKDLAKTLAEKLEEYKSLNEKE